MSLKQSYRQLNTGLNVHSKTYRPTGFTVLLVQNRTRVGMGADSRVHWTIQWTPVEMKHRTYTPSYPTSFFNEKKRQM